MNRYIVVEKAGYEGEPDRKVCLSECSISRSS
jgi:hypothetical protein